MTLLILALQLLLLPFQPTCNSYLLQPRLLLRSLTPLTAASMFSRLPAVLFLLRRISVLRIVTVLDVKHRKVGKGLVVGDAASGYLLQSISVGYLAISYNSGACARFWSSLSFVSVLSCQELPYRRGQAGGCCLHAHLHVLAQSTRGTWWMHFRIGMR
jgi:hypothetical protein